MAPQALDPIAAKFGGTAVTPAEPAVDPVAQKYGGTIDPIAAKFGGTPEGTRPAPIQVDRQFDPDAARRNLKLTVGGQPYATGAFTPLEAETVMQSPPGQATVAPSMQPPAAAVTIPPEPPTNEFGFTRKTPVSDGIAQISKAIGALVQPLAHPAVLPVEPHVVAASAFDPQALAASSDLMEGAMKVGTPLAIAGALVDLPGTVATMGLAYLASLAAGKVADVSGASDEVKRFFANLAGTATALGGAKVVLDRVAAIPAAASKQGRALALAGRLSGYGQGDVPGFRAEPYVAEATTRPSAGPLEGTPEFEAAQQRGREAAGIEATAPRGPSVQTPAATEAIKPPPAVLDPDAQAIRDQTATAAAPVDPTAAKFGGEPVAPPTATPVEPVKDRALSPGEEEGIAHLEQLQNAIHGDETAPTGNGQHVDPIAEKFGGEPVDVPNIADKRAAVPPGGALVPIGESQLWNRLDQVDALVERGILNGHITEDEGKTIEDLVDGIEKAVGQRTHVSQHELDAWDKQVSHALKTAAGAAESRAALSTQTEQALPPTQMSVADIKAEIASHDERPVAAERLTALRQELAERKSTPPAAPGNVDAVATTDDAVAVETPTEPETPSGIFGEHKTEEELRAELPEITAPNVSLNDVSRDLANRAHSGTSWTPERRGAMEQREYVKHMQAFWTELERRATTPEQQATLRTEFDRYRTSWLAKYGEVLASRGRLMSAGIAGPSNFPARRQQKLSGFYEKRSREFVEWDKRARAAVVQAVDPRAARAISSDRSDAGEALQEKLVAARTLQDRMKAANRIIRSKALSDDQKIEQLRTQGFSERTVHEVLKPDYMGRIGFADYQLTNNAANIRRMETRIAEIARERDRSTTSATFEGGRVEDDVDANRVRIYFDQKPSADLRARLKGNGFKWAPTEGVWQRLRNDAARRAAESILSVTLTVSPLPTTGETPPTVAKPAADDDRQALIDRIVAAARKPAPTIGRTPKSSTSILPVTESKGTDGKWYRGGNFPTGVNVAQPHEQRTIGYSIESEHGTRVGTIEKTAEAVLERWQAAQAHTDDDMRQHLEQEPPERLASQAAYWLKEEAPKPKAPAVGDIVSVKGQRGIVRALVTAGKKGGKGVHRLRARARVLFKDDKTGQFYEQHVDLDQLTVAPSTTPPIESPTIEDTHEGAAQAPAGPIQGNSRVQLHGPARGRVLTKEERADRRRAREDTRAEAARFEQEDLDALVTRAQQDGFTGDPAVLRAELVDRLQGIKEINAEFDESGTNGLVLLRAIAHLGGLSVKAAAAAGQRGELAWLKEFQDRRSSASRKNLKAPDISVSGQIRGVRGVFRESTAQTRGGRAGGQSLDGMLTKLQQDPRFYYLTTTDELTEAIRSAAMGREDSKDAIASLTGWLASQTWDAIGTATHDADEYPGDADSFDPVALEAESAAIVKPVADVLDTGEVQPRLPGAEDARQVGNAETSFRAPVQASGGDFSLETPLTDAQKADDAKRAGGPSMFDDVEQDVDAMEVEEPRSRGPIAQATLVPGLGQFTERDVIPALKTATKDVTEAHSAIRALWAPARVSESAETMAAIMRPNLALRRQRDAMARKNMRKLEVAWDRMPRAAQLAFAMAVDEGAVDTLPASQQELAKLLNSINSHKRHEANALGGKVGYIEHYFPREWVKPGKVREFVMRALYGKRPLQGRAGFKKARARDKETGDVFSFRTLHKAGFEPVSYNPITAHLRKWTEMDKWIAARRILLEAKQYGVATFVRIGDKPPDGEVRYPESFGTVYGPPTIEVKEAYDAGLMEALHRFATEQGITTVRRLNLGGNKWGYHVRKGTRSEIHTRFGGPEGVLMHEIGHALDHSHGLGEKIGLAQSSERREEINFAETPSKVIKELRALADLRLEKGSSKHFRQYVRNRAEVIANLVHAFLYAPDLARQVAPNAYWALYNLAKDTPDLRGLLDIQKARSLRVGVNTAVARIDGKVIKGYYYGPRDAVRLLDNYLSPGLRGNVMFDLYRAAGNFLNQVQLGLSVFHVLTTATNSTISRGALALEQASRGQAGPALKNAAITATLVGPPILDVIRGHRYLKAFYAKDAQFRELVHEADIIAKGGGGVGWDTFWHSSAPEQFLQAIRGTVAEAKAGNYPGALVRAGYAGWRTIPAALELLAKPVMEWWVPRLKLAAFLDLARMELRDLGPRPDSLEAAKVLGKAWDSIDNRFGELIYDNIFWHGILKDAGMASVRALGWNLGTVREVFGAIPAQAAQFGLLPGAGGGGGIGKPPQRLRNTGFTPDPDGGADIPVYERGRAPWLVHSFAYFMALLYVGAIIGAIYQYGHTGKRPGETDDGSTDPSLLLLDLYFPRTGGFKKDGRPERATLWTYMKDVFAFMRHPIDTAAGKLHPALSLAIDILRNEDYFGNAMRNGDDPIVQQATDIFAFIGQQYQPISVKSFVERKAEKGESGIGPFESFLGINVAPQKVTRTAAEDYLRSIAPATHRTKEEAVKAEARRDLRAARQDRDGEAARAAVTAGNLSRRSILLSAHSARKTALQRAFQTTTLPQAIHAYELATPEERTELRTPLARKWHSLFKDVAPDAKRAMADRFGAAIKLPVARLGPSARQAAGATR